MSEIRDGYVEKILKFLRHAQILDNSFSLLAKVSIDLKCFLCVYFGHLKVVFCTAMSKHHHEKSRVAPSTLITPSLQA